MITNENAPDACRHGANLKTTYAPNTNQDQANSQADSMPLLCSGYGQFHTDEPGKETRKPYAQINFKGIQSLVDTPQQVGKQQAQWLIPSTLPSRSFKEQEVNGEYWMLWADIDQTDKPLVEISRIVSSLVLGFDFEIYTSKSATLENQKCRILIPLASAVSGADWVLAQEILNDKLSTNGVTPDRTSERPAQLCYLPNHGEYYDSNSARGFGYFDPAFEWSDEFRIKLAEISQQAEELEKLSNAAKSKREAFKSYSDTGRRLPDLIGFFNQAYTVQDILLQAGYIQHGNTFRHPYSESGSYSASVKNGRAHSLSSNDPLFTGGGGGGAHDAFSAFTVLQHNGDEKAALKDAGDNLLMIGGEPWNKVKQREYAQQKADESTTEESKDSQQKEETIFSLKKFDITGDIETMREKMLNDVFVMDGVALLGQITALYAAPNTGKTLLTLRMLIDSVVAGRINGDDVFYINADDTCKGLITKAQIFKSHGMHMLAPDHNDFKVAEFVKHLRLLIKNDTARGVIVVLDTLKKFANLMDKQIASAFMTAARSFVSRGGSLILLAHTNKRRDGDNSLIAGGTSDVIDDADCAYIIDAKKTGLGDTKKMVIFENRKSRGDVERELCFSYSIQAGLSYSDKLTSAVRHSQDELHKAKAEAEAAENLEKDLPVIEIIQEVISSGVTKKTELVKAAHANGGGTQPKIRSMLDRYKGKQWGVTVDVNNTSIYYLLVDTATADEYRSGKNGY
jgi:archaellum biogenesis ATPase FlaH